MNSVLIAVICTKKILLTVNLSLLSITHDYNASIFIDLLTGLSECITPMIFYMIPLTPYHVPTNPIYIVGVATFSMHIQFDIYSQLGMAYGPYHVTNSSFILL